MIKKTITYMDYNGKERTEDFYFNLTKAELMEMAMSTTGGLDQLLHNIISAQDNSRLVALFKELVLKAYGVKSADGRRFIKSKELSDEFSQTEAYSDLFMELSSNEEYAISFVNGIVPQEVAKEASEELAKLNK